ncbi:MAG: 2-methylcitrate dehydratase, partial [Gaiellales bacterium]
GAAAAAGRLLGLGGPSIAGAIDAASALSLAPPFAAALRGSYVRNTWIGASGAAGLVAARLGAAGLVGVDALAGDTFGAILGTLDVDELTADLGERYEILGGYFKRHAACAYTHPVADAVLELRAAGLTDADPIQSIEVETYSAAATLDAGEWPTRLAAMFSIPYVVAETLQSGSFGPAATSAERRADATNRRLADAVSVRATAEFDERLPVERGARVTVVDRSGNRRGAEVRNPIGDADHQPLGWPEVGAKLAVLIGEPVASRLRRGVTELPASATIAPWVSSLTMPGDGA